VACLKRLADRLGIHPCQHQHFATCGILGNRRDQSGIIVTQGHGVKRHIKNLCKRRCQHYLRGSAKKGNAMSTETDLIKLYSARILALAADMPRTTRLENPTATSKKRAPLCGSTVTVDVILQDGIVADYGQDVKACALGQAAAAVVGAHIVGMSVEQVQSARDALFAMLKEDGPVPPAPFDALEVLQPAKEYKNRHASIMLAFDATLDALQTKQASA
jgi:NifU-like protein involved in Fe-S cluster formation